MNRHLLLLLTCLVIAGCVSAPPQAPSRTPTGSIPTDPGESTNSAAQSPQNSTTALLLRQGQAERDAGLYQDATTSIERALRIDPNNANLWIELSEIKHEEGDHEQAQMMARKALTLAAGDRALETRANRLIRR